MSESITLSRDELKTVVSEAIAEDRKSRNANGDFQPMWRAEGKRHGSAIVESPQGEKFWLNIFPNKYFKKLKKGKQEQPMFHYTVNPYKPGKKK